MSLSTLSQVLESIFKVAKDNLPKGIDSVFRATYEQKNLEKHRETFAAKGIEFIGAGSNRAVFGYGSDMVLKIDFSNGWTDQCAEEIRAFEESAHKDMRYLMCPIVTHGKMEQRAFLTMPRAKKAFFPITNALQRVMHYNITKHFNDSHEYNVGVFNSGMVVFDYFNCHNRVVEIDDEVFNEWYAYTEAYDQTVNKLTNA